MVGGCWTRRNLLGICSADFGGVNVEGGRKGERGGREKKVVTKNEVKRKDGKKSKKKKK